MRERAAMLVVVVALAGCGGASQAKPPARVAARTGPCASPPGAGDHRIGTALLHVPPHAGHRRLPLLVVAHGAGGSGPQIARALGVSRAADRERSLVLYPTAARRGFW